MSPQQSDSESFHIILPQVSKWLSPNNRTCSRRGHIAYRKAVQKYRDRTILEVQLASVETLPWTMVDVHVDMYFTTNRRRDEDNLVASLKPMYDGLVRAGVVKDDTQQYMVRHWPKIHINLHGIPMVVVTLERIE